jgi:RNA polymerase sigma-70 factor (ECF subfamily)
MSEEPTTAVIQRYLAALPGDQVAEPIIGELLERAAGRLRILCATFLYKSYPRLTRPPVNLETDELLGGVVARLLTALRETAPDRAPVFRAGHPAHAVAALAESGVAAPPDSTTSGLTSDARRMLDAIEGLPEDEREAFDLVAIQGVTHDEAAAVVGVSAKTVQRRLNRARLLLAEQLSDLRPARLSEPTPSPGDTPPP